MQLIDQLHAILRSLPRFCPEVLLSIAVALVTLVDLVSLRCSYPIRRGLLYALTATLIGIAGVWAIRQSPIQPQFLFEYLLLVDEQALFFKLIITSAALITLGHAWSLPQRDTRNDAPTGCRSGSRSGLPLDWLPIFLALVLGLYLMTMAVNLLAIYLSIELVSICSYLLTALSADRKASEGGIKYLLFGAVSSAIMLYGMSLLYGLTGTLDLTRSVVAIELAKNNVFVVYLTGFLTLVGVLFKLSLVPFHHWTPDAYEGAPTPIVAFFSVGPKAAALLLLMRVLTALPGDFQTPLAVLALISITLGNLWALWQTDAKRLLAYSSVAHAGFLLVGVISFNKAGFEAATFYIATYLFINMAAFFLIDLLSQQRNGSLDIRNLSGLGITQPFLCVALTVVMIGLTGLPPTVGFTAKLLIFSSLWEAYQQNENGWLLVLFGLGLLNTLVSLFYYLKLPYLLFFRSERHSPSAIHSISTTPLSPFQYLLAGILTIPVLLLFFKPDWLLRWIQAF